MDEIKLDAQRRDAGHVRHLRKRGLVPGNVFGKGVDSLAIQVPMGAVQKALQEAGRTGIIRLNVEGEKAPRRVMVANLQRNALGNTLQHVDLHQVDMRVAIHTAVPLVFVGQSEAAKRGDVVVHSMSEVELEALPAVIPDQVEVDLSPLAAVGDQILASDLVLPEGVTLHVDGEALVAHVQAARVSEAPAEEEEAEPAEA